MAEVRASKADTVSAMQSAVLGRFEERPTKPGSSAPLSEPYCTKRTLRESDERSIDPFSLRPFFVVEFGI